MRLRFDSVHVRRTLFVSGALMGLAILSGCKKEAPIEMLNAPPTAAALQSYWQVPEFTLTERSGREVQLADLKGKVWLADFVYTTCPGPCPILSTRMSEVQKALGNESDVRLVSISTDPESDTPAVLKEYAERYKAGDHWWFLTGKKDAVYSLAREGFKLPIADAAPGAAIIHSTRIVLVDKKGTVRGFYEGTGDLSAQDIANDVRKILAEK